MKRCLAIMLTLILAVSLLTGCGGKSGGGAAGTTEETFSPDSLKTMADVIALGETVKEQDEDFNCQTASVEGKLAYVFNYKGTYYRVIADMPKDVFDASMDLDYSDENYEQKYNELISPLEIRSCENLSELIPPQEELDKLVGKTGEDLLNDGWYSSGYNLDEMEFYLNKDPFLYNVVFDGKLELTDDFDETEAIKPLKVKSVEFSGLGDASGIE